MAKIKHNNFLETVDSVFSAAKRQGVLHLYAEGGYLDGRHIHINGKKMYHFGTTGYLGLEQDKRLKKAAVEAILKYGTQFPLSKTYVSNPLYRNLEVNMSKIYGCPTIITKNSTLGHMGVIPSAVGDGDAIILDHQVHWSVQSAAKQLKLRSVPIEMIRHNRLDMLEDKIKRFASRPGRIWYMIDGVYSMYGDVAPMDDLMALCHRYPKLYLYVDDVHGMSWSGKHGAGYVMGRLGELPHNILLFGTLSKTFGASGAVLACQDKKMFDKIKNFGGPLTFSAQLEPASIAAALASSEIHLSPEIYTLQDELREKIRFFNSELEKTELPLIDRNGSPVFYIGTGLPVTGYDFVNRMMQAGFFVNLGIFPAVPVKNTGVRITISRHNRKREIKDLVRTMAELYPLSLKSTGTDLSRVHAAFGWVAQAKGVDRAIPKELELVLARSIHKVDRELWNSKMAGRNVYDWDGMAFLEGVYSDGKVKEHHWEFFYFLIQDSKGKNVLTAFCTMALWKDDMLAPESVSGQIERIRKERPYHRTSWVLAMGSPFTEGPHLHLDREHPLWEKALRAYLDKLGELHEKIQTDMVILRDFDGDIPYRDILLGHGYLEMDMPDSCSFLDLGAVDMDHYVEGLSARSRRHFRKEVGPFVDRFHQVVIKSPSPSELLVFEKLYQNVNGHNLALNLFPLPSVCFSTMGKCENWEFLVLDLKAEYTETGQRERVGVMFCYRNGEHTYVPAYIGMDYRYAHHQLYRQLLYRTITRAKALGFDRIDFGMTASFEKRKLGATVFPKKAYIQVRDNFTLESLGVLRNG
ncbi:bifunctional aminotransferase class I/II-fold pyridoxal phosphate-dependent enzyme/GNAT family N-acetyltransferase [Sediminicola luteus]|uniref:Aminotransferase class I/II n=1 Tax=Sediminicola luteus TaxID=319238 RepID=A0A2A4G2W4_9FLAO|nr:bifunctional aminotransferase class I/II-fold pyridoxal phosphate-dependent enzyme/GNAT family N-acetyltransferase [Sediminicola luteus]PCE63017.1 aminotransferase class I/II [Sediminicola luteus]